MPRRLRPSLPIRQHGAAAAEFAVVSVVFLALTIGVMEFARVMFVYSTAVEATRLGARLAVVCDEGDTDVKRRMRIMLDALTPDKINIAYPATDCSAASCDPVTVRIQNVMINTMIPFIPLSFPVPDFVTSLPAESRDSTDNGICT